MTGAHERERDAPEEGSAYIGTVAGILVFLVFLLFAVQVLVGLYSRSVVTSAAYDGARSVAGSRVDHDNAGAIAAAQEDATARMREMLGGVGTTATFDWAGSDDETIVLRVHVDNRRFSFPGFDGPLATDHIDRTIRVRVERER